MNKLLTPISVVIAILIFVTIPILLNWILRWDVMVEVITDINGNGPATWLIFWGAYLSAIGSLIMAYIALHQNRRIREDNANRIKYEEAKAHYDILSKFINEVIPQHNIRKFCYIYYCAKQKDNNAYYYALKELNRYVLELEMVQYQTIDTLYFHHNTLYDSFFVVLKEMNKQFLEHAEKMTTIFINHEFCIRAGNTDRFLNELALLIGSIKNELHNDSFRDIAFDLLHKEQEELFNAFRHTQ